MLFTSRLISVLVKLLYHVPQSTPHHKHNFNQHCVKSQQCINMAHDICQKLSVECKLPNSIPFPPIINPQRPQPAIRMWSDRANSTHARERLFFPSSCRQSVTISAQTKSFFEKVCRPMLLTAFPRGCGDEQQSPRDLGGSSPSLELFTDTGQKMGIYSSLADRNDSLGKGQTLRNWRQRRTLSER